MHYLNGRKKDINISGTKSGGQRAKSVLLAKNPDHYKELGRKGGTAVHKSPRGFARMSFEQLSEYGKIGGRLSKRRPRQNKPTSV